MPKSNMAFDYPVYYDAEDSILFDFIRQKAYLYGNAVVIYESINLTAAFIEMDFNTNEVFAFGLTDSTGIETGRPLFKDNEENFEADTIRYNFRSKKGIIKQVTSEFDGSYLHGGKTKKQENGDIHMIDGKFTTCDLDHPHYYFKISKAKVIPNDKIVSGPAYLIIEDIPTPLGIPFGFFPNSKGGSNGLIIPEFGEETNRGFFLRKGGYYWAINDYMDLTVLGDLYSKGSWGVSLSTNYKVKYKYSGNLIAVYNKNSLGYKGLPNYSSSNLYSFRWKFNQDPKAKPNSTFTADVNLSSSNYDKYNSYSAQNYMSTNKTSSISYSKNWSGTPFSMTAAMRQNQNSSTNQINLTLPDVSFVMNRIYPFKRSVKVGKTRFYEKIGISYNMSLTNKITTQNDSTFLDISFNDITNGIYHRIPVSTSFKFLKYTTITPSFNYGERWYFKELSQSWGYENDTDTVESLVSDYYTGFSRAWDYNAALNWSTQIYGMFNFKQGRVKAIRHVVSPNISFSYRPDFGQEKYGYYDEYNQIIYNNTTGQYDTISNIYSKYLNLPYGSPARGGAGSVNFNIGNNVEMKVRNPNDTAAVDKKIKLLESLVFSTNYNIMSDSLNWAPLAINGRTKINLLDLNFKATVDPYAFTLDPYGNYKRINEFLINTDGQLARLTLANISAGISLRSSKSSKSSDNDDTNSQYETLYGYPDYYVDFNIPWNVRFSYSFNYRKPYEEASITQSLRLTGDFNLTTKWKISFSSGYDFISNKATYTTIDIYRDLHCWEASLHLVPFGLHKAYMFQINVKASMLKDLKLAKRRSWVDNF
jgi:lipopolysaccharide assembly outer membrane protein LptD (OstA)